LRLFYESGHFLDVGAIVEQQLRGEGAEDTDVPIHLEADEPLELHAIVPVQMRHPVPKLLLLLGLLGEHQVKGLLLCQSSILY